ncbi:MAG: hypothetical protein FJX76_04285 [Armatimonadetes bacterium]|nr:hypothetical protein [Armatimonadota bacterium]
MSSQPIEPSTSEERTDNENSEALQAAPPPPPEEAFAPERQIMLRRLFSLVLVGCVIIFAVQAVLYARAKQSRIDRAHEQVTSDVAASATRLADRLRAWQDLTEVLGTGLARPALKPEDIRFLLNSFMSAHPHISMIRVAYAPGVMSREGYTLGCMRHDGRLVWGPMHSVDGVPTYTSAWYRNALKSPLWTSFEVLPGPDRPREFSTYSRPLSPPGGNAPIGVVGVSVDSDELSLAMSTSLLGHIGYGLLVATDGTLLVHPRRAWVLEKRKLLAVANESGDTGLAQVAASALSQQRGLTHYHDPLSGQITWAAYAPVHYNGWSAIYILYEDEILGSLIPFRQARMGMGLTAAVGFVMLVFLVAGTWRGHGEGLWIGSGAIAVACVSLIAWLWHLNLQDSDVYQTHRLQAIYRSSNGIQEFEQVHKRFSKLERLGPAVFIPTGIFLESVSMPESDQATVSGYIWQKYSDSIPASVSRGVTFPDDVKNTTLSWNDRAYDRKDGSVTTVGWQFQVTLRQSFDYQKYPFDRQSLNVRLWHQDFDRNNVLVPDYRAYESFNPQTRPGLDATFGVGGFTVDSSFFNRLRRAYNTNFGIPSYASIHSFPELQYSVLLTRDYPGPLLSNLFPLLMVLCTVFVNLMSFNRDDKPWGIYATIASLFFTSLLAHLKLRDIFNIHQIIYLEYFYAASYAVIVVVVCNCFLLMAYPNLGWMTWRNNLVAKLSYWPLLCLMLAAVSYYTFY